MKKLVSVLFTVAFVSILAMSLLAQEGPSQNEAAGASSKEKNLKQPECGTRMLMAG